MKKKNLIACCLLLSSIFGINGCKKETIDTYANVSYENNKISNNKGESITVGEIYDYIVKNQQDEIAKQILKKILKKQVNLEDSNMLSLYKKYLSEYFQKTFVDSSSYNYNGQFSEELVVKYLQSESYIVKCGEGITSGLLENSNFSCDYSDYISKEVDYDIYMKMLKVKYIIEEKSDLIDRNDARRITYYTISKGTSDNETRELLEGYVASFEQNHSSQDETLIRNIKDVAEKKRKEDLDEIAEQYAYISTSSDSSSGYTYLNKFTNCGDKRCSIEEGKEYQDNLIMKKDYHTTMVVTKADDSILYEEARKLLFSDDIGDYLYTIGDNKYLISPAYVDSNDKRVNDIVLFDSKNGNYYLVAVEVINSQSQYNDKVEVAEKLIDKISDSTIMDYCFEDIDLKIYDKDIYEYFVSKYGEIED